MIAGHVPAVAPCPDPLEERFGDVPERVAEVAEADVLSELHRHAIRAASLEELEAVLQHGGQGRRGGNTQPGHVHVQGSVIDRGQVRMLSANL